MENFALLLLCLLAGIGLQFVKGFPKDAHKGLNAFIIYISLPALTLLYIPQMHFQWEILYPVLMDWIVFVFALLFFPVLGRWLNLDKGTVGCLILTCGLCNTSFVGFPLIETFYGEDGLQIAVLLNTMGSFLVLSTLGIGTAAVYASGKWDVGLIFRKLISFPPTIAFLLSLLLLGQEFPDWMQTTLKKLGSTMTPLALVSVGLQLRFEQTQFRANRLLTGLGFKLFLAPLLIYVLYVQLLGGEGLLVKVPIVEAAMPPMVTGSIVASEYGLNPKLASLLVGVGIPLSFLTVYGWYLWVG